MLVAGIDDMNWLEILRVPVLQHRNKSAGIEVLLDMELAGPAKPNAGQADLTQHGAAGNQQVAADRDRPDAGLTGGAKKASRRNCCGN